MTTDANPTAPLAVVTGASTGIGRALAHQFADHGFDLLITADEPLIAHTAVELGRAGTSVTAEQVDLATADGVQALHQAIRETGRPVAAAALNVGIGTSGAFHETDLDDELRVVDVNVRSTVHLAKLLVEDMVARNEGRLLFTASVAARAPGPYYATYAASKSFVHSFAEAIRYELKDTGVTVTSLMPGPTDTAFFERNDMEDTRVASMNKDDPDEVARDGFEALMAGKDHVVGGAMLNKAEAVGSRAVPDPVAAAAQARLTKPGTGSGSG
ncbi:MAG TPA: SDR family NAD(P)-dependent oxidoreductase [Nocardioidaceae bacterium]|nr:SDR family NAD(P)-dependent oxidoreductase [Nocardioidaceae bacterium]